MNKKILFLIMLFVLMLISTFADTVEVQDGLLTASKMKLTVLPTSPPGGSNVGVICISATDELWVDNDGTEDCA